MILNHWAALKERANWVLFFVSLAALTRGVLYTLPGDERVPRGLDLLPSDALAVYGILWLVAALYGIYQAFKQSQETWARRFVAGMFMGWAGIYAIASAFPDGNRFSLVINALFYGILAGVSFSCQIKVRYTTIFVVHGAESDAGFEMLEHGDDDAK